MAEPFYRATGREPMGLVRRRHFAVEGRTVLGIEDELFGGGHLGVGTTTASSRSAPPTAWRGYSTLLAALGGGAGTLGDIVATIQAEQDEIIRSPHAGVLVVQGGPGTGKTVVALHRAAYLLYTHRFPLEDQGCSSSVRTGSSCATSSASCPRSARPGRAGRARRPGSRRPVRPWR